MNKNTKKTLLVLGASGYFGGRLVPLLLDKGYRVRSGARNPDKLTCRRYAAHPGFEPFTLNVLDQESLDNACQGCDAAFYLVHSKGPGAGGKNDFASKDRTAAQTSG